MSESLNRRDEGDDFFIEKLFKLSLVKRFFVILFEDEKGNARDVTGKLTIKVKVVRVH